MKRHLLIAAIALLAASTIGVGLYFKHYFVVYVFTIWATAETLIWAMYRNKVTVARTKESPVTSLASLLSLYGKNDVVSERVVEEQILRLREENSLEEADHRWLIRLRDLLELKGLILRSLPHGPTDMREGFAYSYFPTPISRWRMPQDLSMEDFLREVSRTGNHVASLYWKAFDAATSDYGPLSSEARKLLTIIMGEEFQVDKAREWVRAVTDNIHKEDGVAFLILNLLRRKGIKEARSVAQNILMEGVENEEDMRSAMYWVAELSWFRETYDENIIDYDSTIRYLYHLCFMAPHRAAFLEIDSHYFSQFEIISELAREGFLFKESLVDRLLTVWQEMDPLFGEIFQPLFERFTGRKSKIYDDRESWEMIWRQERDNFAKEYLHVVEGNTFYAVGSFKDAARQYEKAIAIAPTLRSANLNLLFAYAQTQNRTAHAALVERLCEEDLFLPEALSTIANSFVMLGDNASANKYYAMLSKKPGWEKKADYYRSMFYHDRGMHELALEFAQKASTQNPSDSSIRFHLSLCYKACGETRKALDAVAALPENPDWMQFYRFTLQRDVGALDDASDTLRAIPREYFDDGDELEQALQFARERRDLVLLRHLRS